MENTVMDIVKQTLTRTATTLLTLTTLALSAHTAHAASVSVAHNQSSAQVVLSASGPGAYHYDLNIIAILVGFADAQEATVGAQCSIDVANAEINCPGLGSAPLDVYQTGLYKTTVQLDFAALSLEAEPAYLQTVYLRYAPEQVVEINLNQSKVEDTLARQAVAYGPDDIRKMIKGCRDAYGGAGNNSGALELCLDRVWERCLDILSESACSDIFDEEGVPHSLFDDLI